LPQGARDGAYRATFEDKPLLSDVIFLKAWVAVDVPKFCNPGAKWGRGERVERTQDIIMNEMAQVA
jgi:hypothetical protein